MNGLWPWVLAEHAHDLQRDTYPRNPWIHRVDPQEFKDYYEAKERRLEQLSTECGADGCENIAEFPRDYCSNECMNLGLQQSMDRLVELMERKGMEVPK